MFCFVSKVMVKVKNKSAAMEWWMIMLIISVLFIALVVGAMLLGGDKVGGDSGLLAGIKCLMKFGRSC